MSTLILGDECDVFGPRASLDVIHAGMCVVFGNETSIGLVYALSRHAPGGLMPARSEYRFQHA